MSPGRRSPEPTFDIGLLDVGALDSPDGLHTALRSIESVCFQADPAMAGMMTALSSRSHVLEYVFSGALRVLAAACELHGLIISPPSVGQDGIRDFV